MGRLLAAFALAPLASSLVFACIIWVPGMATSTMPRGSLDFAELVLAVGTLYAWPATAALAVPAYLVLRPFVAMTIVNCAAVGALISALPWVALVAPGPAGPAGLAVFAIALATPGAIAGCVFWAVAVGIPGEER